METLARSRRALFLLAASLLMPAGPAFARPAPQAVSSESQEQKRDDVLRYISAGWSTLTRSLENCATIVDPKLAGKSILYLPFEYPITPEIKALGERCKIELQHLPRKITALGGIDPRELSPPGLLYLEHPYVVPGGRFNEMYGWDSYFIIRGLLHDGRRELARGMVENFLFEIAHYGAVLNANRTYYLTRSQQPFLSSMILEVYEAEKAAGHTDNRWLARAFDGAKKDYALWGRPEHQAGTTGLARYYDFGDGPTPESLKDETDHYQKVASYLAGHPELSRGLLVARTTGSSSEAFAGKTYDVKVCEEASGTSEANCDHAESVALSSEFYKGDRAMRESGFDISFRFGPYGANTHHFAAVCLNSLLYKTEKDFALISTILGQEQEAKDWRKRAEQRRAKIQTFLWDERRGLFFDYDFEKQQRSAYAYATTFYPLWAGLATPGQAKRVVEGMGMLEQAGGLVMSTRDTGLQWDFPFAWAPLQLLATEGMRHYGFQQEADRLSTKFVSMVIEDFHRDRTIREKYNALTRSSELAVSSGYQANVIGFGWTNGVFLELLQQTPVGHPERTPR